MIKPARSRVGSPICPRCYRWGHTGNNCYAKAPRCPLCSEYHHRENHRLLASCCKAWPKATPPVTATLEGAPCPHTASCINCKGAHTADSQHCPFWKNQFTKDWAQKQYQKVCNCSHSSNSSSNPPHV